MTNSVNPGYRIDKNTGVFLANHEPYFSKISLQSWRQKAAYFRTFTITLTIYIGFKDNVNFDVILRVNSESYTQ